MINATKLDSELRAAGLIIAGCNSDGRVDWVNTPTQAQLDLAAQIIAAHNPYTWAMTCNKTTIAGGLGDVATVTIITTDPTATSASVTVNGAAQSVALTNGVGVLEITADLPRTVVEVVGVGELAGKTLKVFAI